MRTTIRMDDELFRRAKRAAADSGQTLTALIQDSIRERLARSRPRKGRVRVKLPTYRGSLLQPGVDLDDSAALLDLMEGTDGPLRR
ncbi:MAG: CopG family transcriptional regulator [Thermoanaerobaculia bacterium]